MYSLAMTSIVHEPDVRARSGSGSAASFWRINQTAPAQSPERMKRSWRWVRRILEEKFDRRPEAVSDLVRNFTRSGRGSDNGKLGRECSIFLARGLNSTAGEHGKIVASVVLERLPVILPPLSPAVVAFRQFSFEWQQQYRRHYPQEFLEASSNRGEFDDSAAFEPGPAVTEADRAIDRRSLNRALDRRLYLVLHGIPSAGNEGKPVWHFPEKVYLKEPSLRQRFFFKTQLLASELDFEDTKYTDFAWISKEEVPLYFEGGEAEFLYELLQ